MKAAETFGSAGWAGVVILGVEIFGEQLNRRPHQRAIPASVYVSLSVRRATPFLPALRGSAGDPAEPQAF